MRRRLPWLGEVARLSLLPTLISFLMLWPALLGLEVFAPTDLVAADPLIGERRLDSPRPPVQNPLLSDVIDVFIPWKLYARGELLEGRFPLWNPYSGVGTHFHASLQSQVLSPFNLLWLVLPPLWGLGAIAALKWTLCGLGMALLLRALGLGMLSAVFGSVALQLSGPVVGWFQWPIAEGLAWVPWMMWAAIRWVDTLHLRWLAALSAFVAAEVLAGHIETTFHSLAFVSVFCLAALVAIPRLTNSGAEAPRPITGATMRRWLGLLGAGLLGLAISAAQLLPFLEVLPASYQWSVRADVQVQYISMPARASLMWLSPNGFGRPEAYSGPSNWIEANPYVGAVTLLLAAVCLVMAMGHLRGLPSSLRSVGIGVISPRRPLFWLGMAAVSASMAYGIPPLSYLRELPGFNTSFNSRLVSVAGPCLIVLAAMALDRLVKMPLAPRPRTWTIVPILLGLVGMGFLVKGLDLLSVNSFDIDRYTTAWIAWAGLLFCLGAALVLTRLFGWLKPRAFESLVVGLILLDMVGAAWGFNPTVPKETFYLVNGLTKFLIERPRGERVAVAALAAQANTLLALRIADYRIYDPTQSSRYVAYSRLLTPETFRTAFREQNAYYTGHMMLIRPSAVQMGALGIRWLVTDIWQDPNTWQPVPTEGRIYERAFYNNGFAVWENLHARPHFYFAERFQVAPDEETATRRMRALTVDRINQAHIEATGGSLPQPVFSADSGDPIIAEESQSLRVLTNTPGNITVQATARKTRFLVAGEGWAEGWRAEIDGAPVPIYRVNYLLQGVVFPPGTHTVRLTYDPPAFRWGVGISLIAIAVWLSLVYFSIRTDGLEKRAG